MTTSRKVRTVLIAGCGFLGTRLASMLLDLGIDVVALSRTLRNVPKGSRTYRADLSNESELRALPSEISDVVFCAGADEYTEAAYEKTYLGAQQALTNELCRRGALRYLFVSSTCVYEQTSGEWVHEETMVSPEHFAGRTLIRAEALALARMPNSIVMRCSGIYGAPRQRLVQSVMRGDAVVPPGGPWYTNRIHRDDAARAVIHLLTHPVEHSLVIASDDEPSDLKDVLEWLAARLDAPAPRQALPSTTRHSTSKRCENHRLKSCGFSLKFPSYREGYSHELSEDH